MVTKSKLTSQALGPGPRAPGPRGPRPGSGPGPTYIHIQILVKEGGGVVDLMEIPPPFVFQAHEGPGP